PPPPPICEAVDADHLPLPPRTQRPIDVLFVIDDSCSMENDQRALAENFNAFFDAFRQKNVDFHLGAVTTDMNDPLRSGRLVTPFLTPSTPDIGQRFSDMVRVGILGSAIERGLLAAWSALREPNRSGANRGFWRSDADFALVFLGDEDDQSSIDITDFGNFLEAEKRDTDITVGAIVVGRCSPASVTNWRLVQFARRFSTRGVTRLCTSDYADTLRSIAGRIVDARCTVALKRELGDMNRVTVTVNGQPATFRRDPPDEAFPFGSIEVSPCPEAGGFVDIVYEDCFFPDDP
ncbi:MAG: vWA domain-containing protein, partial [Myxococcota bacterium]